MFEKWKSSVISLFNGAVDSSAIVLLFFKVKQLTFSVWLPRGVSCSSLLLYGHNQPISVFNMFCSRCCIVIKLPCIAYKKRRIESQIVKLQSNATGNVFFNSKTLSVFLALFHNYFILKLLVNISHITML